jgi:hypothetical protein
MFWGSKALEIFLNIPILDSKKIYISFGLKIIMPYRIYVLNIEDVSHRWIENPQNVVNSIREIVTHYDYELEEITSLENLDHIVREPEDNIILINGHGETLPIPITWDNNWQLYLNKLSMNINEHGWIIVSITGMPLWCYSSNGGDSEIQWNGLNTILRIAEIEVSPALMYGWVELTKFGKNLSKLYDYEFPENILCSRLLKFSNLLAVSKSLYKIVLCGFNRNF